MENRFEGGIIMNKIAEFRILDLFCGAGGFSYGMHRNEHFKTVVALDFNAKAADTFKKNMPEAIVVTGDITDEITKGLIGTMDLNKINGIALFLLVIYALSLVLGYAQGFIMVTVTNRFTKMYSKE